MKKLILAACLIFTTGAAFSQTQSANGNDHGQLDCQCIGIGIQNNGSGGMTTDNSGNFKDLPLNPASPGNPNAQNNSLTGNHSLLYTYIQIYMMEMSNSLLKKSAN